MKGVLTCDNGYSSAMVGGGEREREIEKSRKSTISNGNTTICWFIRIIFFLGEFNKESNDSWFLYIFLNISWECDIASLNRFRTHPAPILFRPCFSMKFSSLLHSLHIPLISFHSPFLLLLHPFHHRWNLLQTSCCFLWSRYISCWWLHPSRPCSSSALQCHPHSPPIPWSSPRKDTISSMIVTLMHDQTPQSHVQKCN